MLCCIVHLEYSDPSLEYLGAQNFLAMTVSVSNSQEVLQWSSGTEASPKFLGLP